MPSLASKKRLIPGVATGINPSAPLAALPILFSLAPIVHRGQMMQVARTHHASHQVAKYTLTRSPCAAVSAARRQSDLSRQMM